MQESHLYVNQMPSIRHMWKDTDAIDHIHFILQLLHRTDSWRTVLKHSEPELPSSVLFASLNISLHCRMLPGLHLESIKTHLVGARQNMKGTRMNYFHDQIHKIPIMLPQNINMLEQVKKKEEIPPRDNLSHLQVFLFHLSKKLQWEFFCYI